MINSAVKKVMYGILIVLIIVSFIISSSVVYMISTNHENLGQVIKAFTLIKAQSIEETTTGELIQGSVSGMIDALDDPYSVYLDADTFNTLQERMSGTYGGVGLLITKDDEGRLVVVSPFRGTPAHRAGVATGDFIVKINDEDTSDMELETAASLMQGDPGTDVTITTFREGRENKDIAITREIITVPSVDGTIIEEEPDIAYINLSMFNENTIDELQQDLGELGKIGYSALVLDMRNNPGGSLQSAIEVADEFIPEGPVVHIVSKFSTNTFTASGPAIDIPFVVLVNSGSASASEIVAGAIQDTGVGILVGERTFGKGLVQSIFPLDDGAALKLTTAKYLTPNERDINKKGIDPDIEVILTPEEAFEALQDAPDPANDPQLQKAIEIIKSKLN